MGWLKRMMGGGRAEPVGLALYDEAVARARAPHWFVEGAVPDTVDGRFDMIAAYLSIVLMRLETENDAREDAASLAASVTERFVDDMDGQLRQGGIGDIVVGKRIGKLMAMLGGRLGAYRDAIADGTLEAALARNLYRGTPPGDAAVRHVANRMLAAREALAATPLTAIARGELP